MYATATLDQKAYIFGGLDGYHYIDQIVTFDGSKWSKVGTLQNARYAHDVTFLNQVFLVVGGAGSLPSEVCSLDQNGQMSCLPKGPFMDNFAWYPESFIVEENYCIYQ